MATYKEIKGVTIQTTDTDPVENVGTWGSGNTLNTARKALGSFGEELQMESMLVVMVAPNNAGNYVESWNGSTWSEQLKSMQDVENL